jgi:hypothetical protein
LKNDDSTQPTRFSTAPFGFARRGRAELGGEAEVERRLAEGRVPLDHAVFPEKDNRLRMVEDRDEGHAAECLERLRLDFRSDRTNS